MKSVVLEEIPPLKSSGEQVTGMHVVFVHGLEGDSRKTWTADAGDYWPQWVADDFSYVKVWSLSYPAELGSVVEGASPQPDTLALSEQVGSMLWNKLQAQEGTHHPIIFVCHSLGGLLIKRVLVNAWQRGDQSQGCEFDQQAVKAILFCGTPHKGAGLADLLGHFAQGKRILAKYAPMLFGAEEFSSNAIQIAAATVLEPSVLIEELKQDGRGLQKLSAHFSSLYGQRRETSPLGVKVFAEGRPVGVWKLGKLVVDAISADPDLVGGNGHQVPVISLSTKDHLSMVKPTSRKDEVAETLQGLVYWVARKENVFDVGSELRNDAARLVFEQLKRSPGLTNLEVFRRLVPGGSVPSARQIAMTLAQVPHDQIDEYLLTVSDGFKETDCDIEGLLNIGGVLMLLAAEEAIGNESTDAAENTVPLIRMPDMEIPHYTDLCIEVLHAALRTWPTRLSLSSDGEQVSSSSKILRSQHPSSWHVDDHMDQLALEIRNRGPRVDGYAERPDLNRGPVEELHAAIASKFSVNVAVSRAALREEATAILKEHFRKNIGFIVHAENHLSPYQNNVVHEALDQTFGHLIAVALADSAQAGSPVLGLPTMYSNARTFLYQAQQAQQRK
ncbi:MAG: hypothetical protein IH617_02365 [Hydrogenophaga sp.]|nr:hypothetical protein [Hydrogenophaga sp.]